MCQEVLGQDQPAVGAQRGLGGAIRSSALTRGSRDGGLPGADPSSRQVLWVKEEQSLLSSLGVEGIRAPWKEIDEARRGSG